MITEKSYREYLIGLKDMVYKILPLYEEKSETLEDYLESLNFELCGLKVVIVNLPHGIWYVKTIATIEAIRNESPLEFDNTKRIKKEVFKLLSLIDKEIDNMKG